MTRETLIKKTIENISKLPDQKLTEVADFAEFLLGKVEERVISEGIQKLASESSLYRFLEDDDELYSVNDLKEKYK
jgi:Protein of unknown function (DUF2281).